MKPRTTRVRFAMLSLSLLACTAALTACGSEEPKPTQKQVNTSNGTPSATASNPPTPMSDGPPKGTPNTTP